MYDDSKARSGTLSLNFCISFSTLSGRRSPDCDLSLVKTSFFLNTPLNFSSAFILSLSLCFDSWR